MTTIERIIEQLHSLPVHNWECEDQTYSTLLNLKSIRIFASLSRGPSSEEQVAKQILSSLYEKIGLESSYTKQSKTIQTLSILYHQLGVESSYSPIYTSLTLVYPQNVVLDFYELELNSDTLILSPLYTEIKKKCIEIQNFLLKSKKITIYFAD